MRKNVWLGSVVWTAILFSIVHGESFAQQATGDRSIDCERVERSGGNGFETDQCAARKREEADRQLNDIYRKLRSVLADAEDVRSLVAAQRAWIAFRDAETNLCARASGFSPSGSGFSTAVAVCTTKLTIERSRTLDSIIKEVRSR